jgi:putative SOS response-associated peptidase YedK
LFAFAGIWTTWTSVRKAREGEVKIDIFAFLTTEPNAVVAPIHPKAMPLILTEPAEIETWLTASWDDAKRLQRPLRDDDLRLLEEAT